MAAASQALKARQKASSASRTARSSGDIGDGVDCAATGAIAIVAPTTAIDKLRRRNIVALSFVYCYSNTRVQQTLPRASTLYTR
jgi:hypothetical protein